MKKLEPITIYHEPINIRSENVERIATHAAKLGVEFKAETFKPFSSWAGYAIRQLMQVQSIATELEIQDRLHLWPDPDLMFTAKGAKANTSKQAFLERLTSEYGVPEAEVEAVSERYTAWLQQWWRRISEWPGMTQPAWTIPEIPDKCFLN